MAAHHDVVIVGAGQAGLSLSIYLRQRGLDHVLLEKHTPVHTWREQRWDSFCLVTPNWQCRLPGWDYRGDDPHGFMRKPELVDWLDGFVQHAAAPVLPHCAVRRAAPRAGGGFEIATERGDFTADQLVVASGGYHLPVVPRLAERLPRDIVQLHSGQYRNPQALPPGAVLVVGNGQSGAQIAEDLHLAGRRVVLATGDAPRCARFYRGKDVVDWLAEMNYYDMPVQEHPLREGVRDNTNHYVTGRDGGRDIDLRRFASEGMALYGPLRGLEGDELVFAPELAANLAHADKVYNGINASIDRFIAERGIEAPAGSVYEPVWEVPFERERLDLREAGISAVIWCIGFQPDFGWLDAPVFNGRGHPSHLRGVTGVPGLYFLGLPWLHTWGSGRFSGVSRDALYLAERIEAAKADLGGDRRHVLPATA